MNYHTGTGKIIYDPHRGSMKKRTQWWCVAIVDKEITRYYRWWIRKELHIKNLHGPSWDAHISIIRGEKPEDDLLHLWKKYHGERISFRYIHNPYQAFKGQFWAVEVVCPRIREIREELRRPTNWKLHLTVGRTYD